MRMEESVAVRDRQKFKVVAIDLLPGVTAKIAMHESRVTHWEGEFKTAADALTVLGPVAVNYAALSNNAYNQSTVGVAGLQQSDFEKQQQWQQLSNKQQTAQVKIGEHKLAAERLKKWQRILTLFPKKVMKLTLDDLEYFQVNELGSATLALAPDRSYREAL